MRNRHWARYSRILALLVALIFITGISLALSTDLSYGDAGGKTSHSTSKSSTSKSSSSSSTSRTSSSGFSSGYGTGLGLSMCGFGNILGLVVFIIIVLVVITMLRRRGGSTDSIDYSEDEMPDQSDQPEIEFDRGSLQILKDSDPNFAEPVFLDRINNMYVQLQEAWTKKDWKVIRPFETDALFNQHAKLLQQYIDNHTTNVVDDIGILSTEIIGYRQEGPFDVLDVLIKTRIKDYVIDDETGKVIEGDKNQEIFMTYRWTMIRRKGVSTKLETGVSASQCPNCGANMSINASGECEYCGSVVSNAEHDWVLASIDLISQN